MKKMEGPLLSRWFHYEVVASRQREFFFHHGRLFFPPQGGLFFFLLSPKADVAEYIYIYKAESPHIKAESC